MQVEVVQICEVVSEYCTGRVCDVEHIVFKKKRVLRFCFFSFVGAHFLDIPRRACNILII
jgi:hypothetical protein